MTKRGDKRRTPGHSRRSKRAVEPPFAAPIPRESPDMAERRAIEDEACGRPIEPPQAAPDSDPGEMDHEELLPVGPSRPEGEESDEAEIRSPRPQIGFPVVKVYSTAEILAPSPPVEWIVPELQLAPGRPALLYGVAGAGKTIIAQSLALAIAAGVPLWGQFQTRKGRVLHVDYDVGGVMLRYRRLAAGHGVGLSDLGDRLSVIRSPPIHLDSGAKMEAFLEAHCKGVLFCVIDALRTAAPKTDENDSRMGGCLTLLSRVSAQTSTAFLVLHHVGKVKDDAGDSPASPRGSSAILAASGAGLLVTGRRDAPKRVRVTRDSESYEGAPTADFMLRFDDGAESEGVRSLRVVHQGATPGDSTCPAREDAIVAYVGAHPGAGVTAIRNALGGNGQNVTDAIKALVTQGLLRSDPAPHGGVRLFVAGTEDKPP